MFKRIMFLPWSHYRDLHWYLFISYEYSNFEKKKKLFENKVTLSSDDSMEFIISSNLNSFKKELLVFCLKYIFDFRNEIY